MQVYWASVGLIVAILVFGVLSIWLGEDDDTIPLQVFCLSVIVMSAVALGMRIEAGIF